MPDKNFFLELVLKFLTNIKKSIFKVEVVNQQTFPKDITIKNPAEFPKAINIANIEEAKTEIQQVEGKIDVNKLDEVISTLKAIATKEPKTPLFQKKEAKEVKVKDFDKLINKKDKDFPSSLKINNLDEIIVLLEKIKNKNSEVVIPDSFKISNLGDMPKADIVAFKEFDILLDSLKNISLLSGSPKKPVAVRLSDGEKFYNSVAQAIVSSSGGRATEAKQDDTITEVAKGLVGNTQSDGAGTKYHIVTDNSGRIHTRSFKNAAGDGRRMLVDSDRHGQVDVVSLTTPVTTALTLTTAGTQYLMPASEQSGRKTLIIYNVSDTDVFIGASGVTITTGIELPSGGRMTIDCESGLYAVCGTAGKIINLLEIK